MIKFCLSFWVLVTPELIHDHYYLSDPDDHLNGRSSRRYHQEQSSENYIKSVESFGTTDNGFKNGLHLLTIVIASNYRISFDLRSSFDSDAFLD